MTEAVGDPGHDHRGEDRVAAELEVVIGDADALETEDLAPDRGQLALGGRPRLHERPSRVRCPDTVAGRGRRAKDPQSLGHPDALDLAGGPLRDLADDADGPRHLEGGETRGDG